MVSVIMQNHNNKEELRYRSLCSVTLSLYLFLFLSLCVNCRFVHTFSRSTNIADWVTQFSSRSSQTVVPKWFCILCDLRVFLLLLFVRLPPPNRLITSQPTPDANSECVSEWCCKSIQLLHPQVTLRNTIICILFFAWFAFDQPRWKKWVKKSALDVCLWITKLSSEGCLPCVCYWKAAAA